jgi:hypothetical protein
MSRRQIHIRVTEAEYSFLRTVAADADEPVNRVLRRLIRKEMANARAEGGPSKSSTTLVNPVLPSLRS